MAPSPPDVVFSTGPESTTPRAPAACVPMTLGGVPVAGSAGGCEMFRTHVATVACTLSPMANWPVGAVTVTPAVPLFPSLVAVIVADPAPVAVTNPVALTVATEPLLVAQVTARPTNGLPAASLGVAVSCEVCPVCRLIDAGLTLTVATGAGAQATVMLADAFRLPGVLVAVRPYWPQLALW